MGVTKLYTKAEAKAAIDCADGKMFKKWRSVRNDLTNAQFAKQGKDVGHTFRHVEGSQAFAGKSTYENADVAAEVTMQLLNSPQGQKMLQALDTASPDGSHVEQDPANRKIEAAVTGDWYGASTAGGAKVKITKAACQVMKLGESVLWVHTSYPTAF